MEYDNSLLPAISTRIKIMGGMDIAEKRKPQDGRMSLVVDGQEYDIRISSVPTVYGEKIVMRISSKVNLTKDKKELGLAPDELKRFDHMMSHPHGIIFVTGPTGSGKSTTLYTALSELNSEEVNIVTVEDPVEAALEGINQIQVNNKVQLTFAAALRSILRQDPDIIMIGEIRDSLYCGTGLYHRTFGSIDLAYKQCNRNPWQNGGYGCRTIYVSGFCSRCYRAATGKKALSALPEEASGNVGREETDASSAGRRCRDL